MHSTAGDRDPFGVDLFTKLAHSTQHTPLKRRSSSCTDSPDALINLYLRNLILPSSHKMVLVPVGNMNCVSLGLENTCQGMERHIVSHELFYSLRLRLPSEAELGSGLAAGLHQYCCLSWSCTCPLGREVTPWCGGISPPAGMSAGTGTVPPRGLGSACAADLISSD